MSIRVVNAIIIANGQIGNCGQPRLNSAYQAYLLSDNFLSLKDQKPEQLANTAQVLYGNEII